MVRRCVAGEQTEVAVHMAVVRVAAQRLDISNRGTALALQQPDRVVETKHSAAGLGRDTDLLPEAGHKVASAPADLVGELADGNLAMRSFQLIPSPRYGGIRRGALVGPT